MRKTFLTPGRGPAGRGQPAARAADDVIRIGVLNDQSGLYSDFGGSTSVIAARMAVEDFGGRCWASRSRSSRPTTRTSRRRHVRGAPLV